MALSSRCVLWALLLLAGAGCAVTESATTRRLAAAPGPSSGGKRPSPSPAQRKTPSPSPKAAAASGRRPSPSPKSTSKSAMSGSTGSTVRKAVAAAASPAPAVPQPHTPPGWAGPWVPDQVAMLKLHNHVRVRHGAVPLAWDDALAAQCAAWVSQCIWAHSPTDPRPNIGENMYFSYGDAFPAAKAGESAVKSWYREKEKMNWAQPELTAGEDKIVGHFTAMVWRSTKRVGCAFSSCRRLQGLDYSGSLPVNLVCCHYTPAGNYRGSFRQNVLPEGSNATTAAPAASNSATTTPSPSPSPSPVPSPSPTYQPEDTTTTTTTYYPEDSGYYEGPAPYSAPYSQPYWFFGRR